MKYIGLLAQLNTDVVRQYCGIWASPSECKMLHKTECRCCLDGSAALGCCYVSGPWDAVVSALLMYIKKSLSLIHALMWSCAASTLYVRVTSFAGAHQHVCLWCSVFSRTPNLGVGKRFPVIRGHSCNDDLSARRLMTQ